MIQTALLRAHDHLLQLHVLESFIARRESEGETAEDDEIIGDVASELLAHQSPDGSWGGSLAVTSEALLLLADLNVPARFVAPVARAEQWLRGRRSLPGKYSEGCATDRHEAGICQHFAGGFFSPAPPTRDLSKTRLSNGLVFPTDMDARLGLSCLALRAVRYWSRCSADDLIHLDTLARLANRAWRQNGVGVSTSALIVALAALTSAPRRPAFIMALHGALTRLAGTQRADGSWPEADPFHVADVFLLAVHNGYGSPVFDAALQRTADLLVLTQHPDGSWGADDGPSRLLSGWRTLRYAERMQK